MRNHVREFYDEDIRAEPLVALRSPIFNQGVAQFMVDLDLSGDRTFDWICDENYIHHRGDKYNWRGAPLDMSLIRLEALFGASPRRTINAYKKRAGNPGTLPLPREHCMRVMFMDFARVIYCARRGVYL